MQHAKRIFLISDFKDESPKSVRVERRRWFKGLIRLGHDVQRFSYRNIMLQSSPFPSKRIAQMFAKRKADAILVEQVKQYHPDIVLITAMKYLDAETVQELRRASPSAIFVGRDGDPFPELNRARLKIAEQLDIMTCFYAGRFLETYKKTGVPICAFMPPPCDPDIQRPYEVDDEWKSDIIFTGKAEHTKLDRDIDRYDLLLRLSKMPNAKIYGAFGSPQLESIDCFYAISGAKIALSINIINDVRLYHSDRLVNCLSCGTFTLAKRVPDTELLFKDGVHLKYFDTAEEFFELADWYLKHDQEREKIAKAGMERAHSEFSCERIAKLTLDLIETGTYDAPWVEIL